MSCSRSASPRESRGCSRPSRTACGERAWTTAPEGRPTSSTTSREALRPGPVGRAHDEVVPVEQADDGGIGIEEAGRLPGDLVQHDRRVEGRPQQRPEARESLGEHAGAALALEELAALERTLRRTAHVPREQDVLVGERARAVEEDDAGVGLLADARDRRADERAVALGGEQLAKLGVEPVVAGELGRGKDAPLPRLDRKRPRGGADADGEAPPDRVRQLVRAGEDDLVAGVLEDDRRRAAERLGGRLRQRV